MMTFTARALFLMALLAVVACDTPPKETGMSKDIDKLSRLIELPVRPNAVNWEVIEAGDDHGMGPDDWTLVALLKFASDDYQTMTGKLRTSRVNQTLSLPALHWYPDDLGKQLSTESSGRYLLFDGKAASAAPFFSPPLQQGHAIPLPSLDALLLVLTTS